MEIVSSSTKYSLLALLAFVVIARNSLKKRNALKDLPLPPGPRRVPILGSALSIDATKPWVTYKEWGADFGDLIYTRLLNMHIVVINSAKIGRDLLDLRSNTYSDRPQLSTTLPYGLGFSTVLLPYGDRWRTHRRIFHHAMHPDAALTYRPSQLQKAYQLVINIAHEPADYVAHIQTFSTSVIMSITYGYDPAPVHDPLVELVENGMAAMVRGVRPETSGLVTLFPFLLHLPTWFPGAWIKREAKVAERYARDVVSIPFEDVKQKVELGMAMPSMVSDALRDASQGNSENLEVDIRDASATAFGAASETTASTLQVFVLAMVLFPEAQRKAQEELDAVVGSNRLPTFDDRSSLPYVEAVMRETLRWHPAAPLGVAHATTDDDVYKGMYIPKGTTVFANLWAMGHDEKTYPKPFEFIPERFIDADGGLTDDNVSFAFGFGRRICVGRYVADASLWIAIASLLTSFRFLKEKDEAGNDIEFEPKFTAEIASRPFPFPCHVVPRQSAAEIKRLAEL